MLSLFGGSTVIIITVCPFADRETDVPLTYILINNLRVNNLPCTVLCLNMHVVSHMLHLEIIIVVCHM